MAKKSPGKSKKGGRARPAAGQATEAPREKPSPQRPSGRGVNRPVLVLALAGMALAGYLSYTSWFGDHPAFCEAGSSCDVVQSSRWGTLLGLPIAFWGFLAYGALAYIAVRIKNRSVAWQLAWLTAFTALGISIYLTAISVWVLEATCPYCLASLGLLAALAVVLVAQYPGGIEGFRWPIWLAQSGAVAAVVVLLLHLHFSGVFNAAAGPEDPYLKALAIHLATEGKATFYGASWCSNCNAQKELFGPAAKRLPYHECSPHGRRAPQHPQCIREAVTAYPTWVIGGRRLTGVQTPQVLAQNSGFVWSGTPPGAR